MTDYQLYCEYLNGKSTTQLAKELSVTRQRISQRLIQFRDSNDIRHNKPAKEYIRKTYKWMSKRSASAFYTRKHQAKQLGIEWTITPQDLKFPEYCPILGIKLNYEFGTGRSDNSPSMDRLDSSKGYIPGNVHIISWRANRIKNDGTAEEHQKIANYMKPKVK